MYRSVQGEKIILQDFIADYTRIPNYHIRNTPQFITPELRLASHKSFFIYNAIACWNQLDDQIKNLPD